MNAKQVGLLVLGVVEVLVAGWIGLLIITSTIAERPRNGWMVTSELFVLALGGYLLHVGIRAISAAVGRPRPKMRFGWGRVVIGSFVIYSSVLDYFGVSSTGGVLKRMQPENQTQAQAMHVTQIAGLIFCAGLVFSGIWQGLRKRQDVSPVTPPLNP
jgi:hypothetical protein